MSATYTGDPATSKKDAVRFLIGDDQADPSHTVSDPQISDEEINWLLSESPNVYVAAATAAESIATTYTGKPDKTVGPLSIQYGELANRYFSLAKNLRHRARMRPGSPVLTQEKRDSMFEIGMNDNPSAWSNPKRDDNQVYVPWEGEDGQ